MGRLRALALRPELGLPLIAILLATYLSFSSEYFLTTRNIFNVLEAQSAVGITAAFATIVIIGGGIDLTPLAVWIISGIACIRLLEAGVPTELAVAGALLAAIGVGCINGGLIGIFGLNPFIVTLATGFIFTGLAFVITDGKSLFLEDEGLSQFARTRLNGGVPVMVIVMAGAFALAWALLRATRFGVHVYAVGGNAEASRLSGVHVRKVTFLTYVLASGAAGVAGVLVLGSSGAVAAYASASASDLLGIIAAVIIGGTALSGGRGGVGGTFVGVVILGMIANGLVLNNISSFYQPIVTGAILLAALILDDIRTRLQAT